MAAIHAIVALSRVTRHIVRDTDATAAMGPRYRLIGIAADSYWLAHCRVEAIRTNSYRPSVGLSAAHYRITRMTTSQSRQQPNPEGVACFDADGMMETVMMNRWD